MTKHKTNFKLFAAMFAVTLVWADMSAFETAVKKTPSEISQKDLKDIYIPTRAENDAPQLTEIITQVEGRAQNYLRYGAGYFSFGGTIWQYDEETEPSPSTIIYGADNTTVYFEDLMDYSWETFTKGILEGNKITVSLPQTLYEEVFSWAEEPYYQNLCVLTQTGEGSNLSFEVDSSITEVTYTLGEDGTITLDPLPEGKALGIMTYFIGKVYQDPEDENSDYDLEWIAYWDGAADFQQKFVPLGVELIEMPEGIEPVTYYCAIEGYNYPVSVANDGEYMYIQGLGDNPLFSNFVVRATVEGDVAYIPQDQYVGVLKYENEMMITKCGYLSGNSIKYADGVNFEFNIDADRRFLEAKDKDLYLCFAYMNQFDRNGSNGLFTYMKDFYIIYQDSYPGVPSNPYGLFFNDDFYEDYDYYTFGFNLSAISASNNIILAGGLYYSIYVDGELQTFEREEGERYFHYTGLDEPTTEIPYMFSNENDIDIWTPTERQIGLYYEGMTTVGVQAIYYNDGKKTESDIVTLNLETGEVESTPAAVKETFADKDIISTEYFDLSGRKIAQPQTGLFIKKTVLEDGSVKTSKVMKR